MGRQASSASLINWRELVDSIQGFKTVHLVAGGSTGPDCTGTPRRSSPPFAPPFVFCCAIIGGRSMLAPLPEDCHSKRVILRGGRYESARFYPNTFRDSSRRSYSSARSLPQRQDEIAGRSRVCRFLQVVCNALDRISKSTI